MKRDTSLKFELSFTAHCDLSGVSADTIIFMQQSLDDSLLSEAV